MFLFAQTTAPMDPALVKWVIVSIAVVLCVGLIGLSVASYVSFSKDNKVASEYLTRVFVGGSALHLLTVLAVILSATVLSLAGALQEGVVALLSGIAGYVLGGLRSPSSSATGENDESNVALDADDVRSNPNSA